MSSNPTSSKISFAFVLVLVGGSFFWWFTHRDSYLMMQLQTKKGQENESAAIAQYQKLLERKNLSKEDEIKFRRALGEFYWESAHFEGMAFSPHQAGEDSTVENPFVGRMKMEFNRVLELDPNDASAHLHLGLLHMIQGTEKYGLDELEAARKADPKYPAPYYYLSLMQTERGHPLEGRDFAQQALAIDPI